MTPAQELRAAASRLRERAKNTTPVPEEPCGWSGIGDETGEAMLFGGPVEDGYRTGTVFWFHQECQQCTPPSQADVAWMETVDPGLAEPLAAWLTEFADWHEASHVTGLSGLVHECGADDCTCFDRALAVARVINGGAP